MTPSSRKLITTTFLDRLFRLQRDSDIIIAITGMLGHDEQYEEISGAGPGMYSVDCGSNQDKILREPIEVRTVAYQAGDTRIFCYVGQEDLACSWATRHRVQLVDDKGVVEVSELTDEGHAVQAYRERYIELSPEDRSPSLLAERIRPLVSAFKTLELE